METLNPSPGQSYSAAAYEAIELRIDWLLDLIKGLYCRVARYDALVNLRAVAGAVVKLVARYEALKFCDERPGATMDDPEVDEIEKRIFASTFQTSNDQFTVTIEPTKRQNEIVDGD